MGEGGGQLVRFSLALSYILGRQIKITGVRSKKRSNRGKGLGDQHLVGLKTIKDMIPVCTVTGDRKGSTEVEFNPKHPSISQRAITAKTKADAAAELVM